MNQKNIIIEGVSNRKIRKLCGDNVVSCSYKETDTKNYVELFVRDIYIKNLYSQEIVKNIQKDKNFYNAYIAKIEKGFFKSNIIVCFKENITPKEPVKKVNQEKDKVIIKKIEPIKEQIIEKKIDPIIENEKKEGSEKKVEKKKEPTPKVETPKYTKCDEFHLKVAGVTFDNRQSLIRSLSTGDKLTLKADKNNPYDSHAVAVYNKNNEQLGFIPKEYNTRMFNNLVNKNGKYEVTVSNVTGGGYSYSYGLNIKVKYYYN